MQVRSLCNHYNGTYRKEGEKFEHSGPLYEHIEPAEPAQELPKRRSRKMLDENDGAKEA